MGLHYRSSRKDGNKPTAYASHCESDQKGSEHSQDIPAQSSHPVDEQVGGTKFDALSATTIPNSVANGC